MTILLPVTTDFVPPTPASMLLFCSPRGIVPISFYCRFGNSVTPPIERTPMTQPSIGFSFPLDSIGFSPYRVLISPLLLNWCCCLCSWGSIPHVSSHPRDALSGPRAPPLGRLLRGARHPPRARGSCRPRTRARNVHGITRP